MTVYLTHPERGGRLGDAEYDPRYNMFRCETCSLKLPASELRRPCTADGCGGVLHFDAPTEAMVCGRDAGHRFGAGEVPLS